MVDSMADDENHNKMAEEFVTAPEGLDISDEEADDHKHAKLLQAIGSLGGTKKAIPQQRTEAAATASEFNLTSQSGKVRLSELVGALKKTSNHGPLRKQLNRLHYRNKALETPLPKFQAEQMERMVAHEKASKDVSKWDSVVEKNRKADHLEFPLDRPDVRMRTMGEIGKTFKVKTSLELEVEKLLGGSKAVLSDTKELTAAEEEALKAMSIEEAQRRRAELQMHRALLSFKAAKARRQNKIKSKRYHRILRKEKLKVEKKAMENLKEKDPTAYADMLLRMHKDHVQERMSLKHRGGSKFMARQKIYGKFDEKNRQAVADMLEKSKELKQKVVLESSSEEEDEDKDSVNQCVGTSVGTMETSSNNPWMKAVSIKRASQYSKPKAVQVVQDSKEDGSEDDDDDDDDKDEEFDKLRTKSKKGNTSKMGVSEDEAVDILVSDSGDKASKLSNPQFQEVGIEDIFNVIENPVAKKNENKQPQQKAKPRVKVIKNKEKERKKTAARKHKPSESESGSSGSDSDGESEGTAMPEVREQTASDRKQREGFKASLKRKQTLEDFAEASSSDDEEDVVAVSESPVVTEASEPTGDAEVDPTKFLTVETRIKSKVAPDLITGGDDEEEDQQRLTIAQAFAADDVVEEFYAEKKLVQEEDKPKDIDLTLPGWGEWGGGGLQVSKWKKKRYVIKAPEAPPRKDRALHNVIISESKDSAIAKHQVRHIPFPFTNVNQFESSVRAPIGKTWNPETSYKELIRPRVTTKIGTIIDPIDPSHIVVKKDDGKTLPDERSRSAYKQGQGSGNKGQVSKEPRASGNKQKRKRKK